MESAAPALAELERIQTSILDRVSALERSLPMKLSESPSVAAPYAGTTVSRLSDILRRNGARDFRFAKVPGDYYDRSFEERRRILGADTVDHLCKSIVMVNTQAPPNIMDCSDRSNSKYYVVVVQYTARLNAEALKAYLYSLNDGKIPKKKFNLRLATEETSFALTGFEHNAVTCVGMKTDIPVILDEAIVKLHPNFFWLGGGEVDLKLGIRTSEFIDFAKPFIVSFSN